MGHGNRFFYGSERRTPRGYDGIRPTSRSLSDVLPRVLAQVTKVQKGRPDLVFAAWEAVVGPTVSSMTDPESFLEGILTVRVQNSTLYSLLNQRDRFRVLKSLQSQVPGAKIRGLRFRLG